MVADLVGRYSSTSTISRVAPSPRAVDRLRLLFLAEDPQAVVILEVGVVLQVERGERQVVGEGAGRDPHVVDRAGLSGLGRGREKVAATASSPGRTGTAESQSASS